MPRVIVRCPVDARPVFTGHRMTEAKLEADQSPHAFRCASCGTIHQWSRADAWVEAGAAVR